MIQVEHLSKHYGETIAVNDLSFRVEPGEVLGLVGPNGAGKTTTLRSIAGIIPIKTGRIVVAGHDISADAVAAKQEIAFVPDDPRLFDYLTVREHLQFIARIYGVDDAGPKARELLLEFELTEKEDALPGALSRGMKQKLAIACGLVHAPRAILFDEPLTGLDPVAIRRMKKTIRKRAAGGAAVIVSSHQLDLVEQISDRILVLQDGAKVAHGTLAELQQSLPALREQAGLEELFMRVTGAMEGEES